MISVVAFWRLRWCHIEAALRFCFGRGGGLLKAFSFLIGLWIVEILVVVMPFDALGGTVSGVIGVVGFTAPIALFFGSLGATRCRRSGQKTPDKRLRTRSHPRISYRR